MVDDVDQWMSYSEEDAKQPCTATRATILDPVSETIVGVKTSAVGIKIVETHENCIKRRQAQVAQVKGRYLPGVPLKNKVTNLSS